MKMKPEVIQQLEPLIPQALREHAWIAGGYAHSPEKAQDLDLWIVGRDDLDAAEIQVRGHLMEKGFLQTSALLRVEEREFGDSMYDEHPHGFRVVANVIIEVLEETETLALTYNHITPVQILVTSQPTIQALLDHFDITTHRIAYRLLEPTTFKVGDGYFPIGAQPRVKRWDTPEQTLQRLEKITARYGFQPHPEDVQALEASMPDTKPGWEAAA